MPESIQKRTLKSYLIENVELWTERGVTKNAQVLVESGKLKALGTGLAIPPGTERFDGQGKVLMPAGVDAQAHLRVPGQAHKETPESGLRAALKGGYCALLTMPNTQPTIDSVDVLQKGKAEVAPFEKDFGVTVYWSAAITKKLNSDEWTDYGALVEAGVKAFTNDGLGVAHDNVMSEAFKRMEGLEVPLLQHAEFLGHGGSLAPGPVQEKVGAAPYPDEPEWKMVERDLRELRKHPRARYHVLHVSSRRTLDFVRAGRKEGLKVSAEVSPHHLFFNTETIDPDNAAFKMNPPIRSKEDQEALWQGLKSGDVDFVATDHAPHEPLMKTGSFDKMAFGTLGLETTLPVLVWGLNKGYLTPERFVEVWATKPAEFLDLPAGHGRFELNAPFHAVWLDVKAPESVYNQQSIESLSKNSCFVGASLPGKILGAFHEERAFRF